MVCGEWFAMPRFVRVRLRLRRRLTLTLTLALTHTLTLTLTLSLTLRVRDGVVVCGLRCRGLSACRGGGAQSNGFGQASPNLP